MESESICLIGGSGFIGFHLHQLLLKEGVNHIIFDKRPPGKHFSGAESYIGDIENIDHVRTFLSSHTFTSIINLAARTDDSSTVLDDYFVNFKGVENLIEVLQSLDFQGTFLQISSQYVAGPRSEVALDSISPPVNVYGESKLLAEEKLRNSSINNWVILRPTNVWGTHHPGFPGGFWRIVNSGLYLHPKKKVIRSYVFVESLCNQISQFIKLDIDKYNKRTFYLSDEPIDSYVWVNFFSLGIKGKRAKVVPVTILKTASIIGDVLTRMKISSPLTSKRFRSMTTNYVIDLKETWELIEKPVFNLEKEVLKTSNWYLENYTNKKVNSAK